MIILQKLGKLILALGITIAGSLGYHPSQVIQNLGSALPQPVAVFETSLASPIGTSDISFTLAANKTVSGVAISGYTCFTVDEGLSNAEYICGTVSGTTVSNLARGIDPISGTTTISALISSHRRGADIKITDWPTLGIINNKLNGNDGFDSKLYYNKNHPCTAGSASTSICDKDYMDNIARQGAATATNAVAGIMKLSVAAVSASNPIALGQNDPVLTTKSGSALTGTTNKIIDTLSIATTSSSNKIVQYQANGELSASSTPVSSNDAVSKIYVDNKLASSNGVSISPSSNTIQTIPHGLGRIPSSISITSLSEYGGTVVGPIDSFGAYNGTTTSCQYVYSAAFSGDAYSGAVGTSSTYIIYMYYNNTFIGSSGISYATTTVDATNIYLNWTSNNSRPFVWEAK